MWLNAFQIRNYKSVDDSGVRHLSRAMNVVVGQNNSGKTSLLQAISLRLSARPHRDSSIRREQPDDPNSSVTIEFTCTGREIIDAILANEWNVDLAIPSAWRNEPIKRKLIDRIIDRPFTTLTATFVAGPNGTSHQVSKYPTHDAFVYKGGEQHFLRFSVSNDRKNISAVNLHGGNKDTLATLLMGVLRGRIYAFDPHRVPASSCRFGNSDVLHPDARNLGEVLNRLQANRSEYDDYINNVRRIIPAIKWVKVVPAPGQADHVQVQILNVDEKIRRDDLAVPLAECGTGIGQVLAILYVVTRSSGNIITIDEPNSFLHPGAARALVSILREHSEHQFIISTHSPEVIIAARPEKLFVLRFQDEKTTIDERDHNNLDDARAVLNEIGARLSDVIGFDAVIWVEGPTEVECFASVLTAAGIRLGAEVAIAPLRSTGDLEGKHAEIVADVYRTLSSTNGILPRAIAVSLDDEGRTDAKKADLRRWWGDTLHFLPCRNYESYLIDVDAIAAHLNDLPTFVEKQISLEVVSQWLNNKGRLPKYKAADADLFSVEWQRKVDGSLLLEDLYVELSEKRETYRKPGYSGVLTRWLLENKRDHLASLTAYVTGLLRLGQQA